MIACSPMVNVETLKVARPAVSRTPLPKRVPPSVKVTVPLGAAKPGMLAVTVAVRVTAWPHTDGLTEAAITLVVASRWTICVRPLVTLAVKFASPPYDAMIVWLPTARPLAESVALVTPFAVFSVPMPNALLPFRNITAPVARRRPERSRSLWR